MPSATFKNKNCKDNIWLNPCLQIMKSEMSTLILINF